MILLVVVPSRYGLVTGIVFVGIVVSVIWWVLMVQVGQEQSMAKVGIILADCMPTAVEFGIDVPRNSYVIADAHGLGPIAHVGGAQGTQ